MHITAFSPSPALADFVEYYGLWDGESGPTASAPEAELPGFAVAGGTPLDMARLATEDFTPLVTGRLLYLRLPGHNGGLGIFFQPAGFFHLFGVPLADAAATGPDGVGRQFVNGLLQRMQEATTRPEWLAAADELLLRQLPGTSLAPDVIDVVANSILHHFGQVSIEALAKDVGLSRRQLERRFLTEVGTAPKLYASIARFNHAYQLLAASPAPDWQDVAYTCGYYDQAHLIREFRRFTGLAPSAYFKAHPGKARAVHPTEPR